MWGNQQSPHRAQGGVASDLGLGLGPWMWTRAWMADPGLGLGLDLHSGGQLLNESIEGSLPTLAQVYTHLLHQARAATVV